MIKKKCLIEAPVDTQSGYGKHSSDICKSLFTILDENEWNIEIIPIAWGNMPLGALDINKPDEKRIKDHYIKNNVIDYIPDLYINITLPLEFKQRGKYNIGITAGTETSIASAEFIECCNKMDLIIVPSKFTKYVLSESSWMKKDPATMVILDEIKLKKPIEILFEGLDTSVYYKTKDIEPSINKQMDKIKEDYCFLFTGTWLSGTLGNDRKDIGMLIHTFIKTFRDLDKQPALILKTTAGLHSVIESNRLLKKIDNIKKMFKGKIPPIYMLYGNLTDNEMNSLYNHPKIKSMITFTHGEGYGRPLLEFSVTGKPLVVTPWSGHVDFIPNGNAVMLRGGLEKIDKSAVWDKILIKESEWFRVDYNYASTKILDVFQNPGKYIEMGRKQANNTKKFTIELMKNELESIIKKYVK